MLTSVMQALAAHLYVNFRGSSRSAYMYLSIVGGLGGLLTFVLFIWACFLTTWWIPVLAYIIAYFAGCFVPRFFLIEIASALLFPIVYIAAIVCILLGI